MEAHVLFRGDCLLFHAYPTSHHCGTWIVPRKYALFYKYLGGIKEMKPDKDKKPALREAAYNLRDKILIKEKTPSKRIL